MVFAGLLGLVVGSFLNVVIHRLPLGQSVVRPRSACPRCGAQVAARDNVPVLSWLLLRGRCRHCAEPISPRYPLVELLTGATAVAVWVRLVPRADLVHLQPIVGPPALGAAQPVVAAPVAPGLYDLAAFLVYFGFFAALIAVSFIDIDHFIIPNRISIPGIPIGIACVALLDALGPAPVTVGQSIAGALAGGVGLYAIAWLGALIYRREAMGLGDVKLLAMIGAFLGAWPTLLVTLLFGSLLGSVVGIVQSRLRGRQVRGLTVPFGPFLVAGAAVQFFFGEELVAAWLGTMA